jgi:hypothetical protein
MQPSKAFALAVHRDPDAAGAGQLEWRWGMRMQATSLSHHHTRKGEALASPSIDKGLTTTGITTNGSEEEARQAG